MIVAFSTSSKVASTAILSVSGDVLWSGREEAPQAASGACLRQLRTGLAALALDLKDATLFAADLGPGSFTGVRVGVTLAKTFAFATGRLITGADAFDLIDPGRTVVVPNKRGEWFIRSPRQAAILADTFPGGDVIGFGAGFEEHVYPDAARFSALVDGLVVIAPEQLVPRYLVLPSISIPKKPYGAGVAQ